MIADILCGNAPYDETALNDSENYLFAHKDMIADLVKTVKVSSKEEAVNAVKDRVNVTCKNILFNTAVFKKDEIGEKGFDMFMKACNMEA